VIRPASLLAGCALLLGVTSCGDGDEPSPGLEEDYDVVIAVCNERLAGTRDFCERFDSSSADQVYANVIFGRAGGHRVTVRTEVVSGGDTVDKPPAQRVPEDRAWLHVVELTRATACTSSPDCELEITAVVDGQDVANQNFGFTGH
jgi:hypothetical protein